MLRKLNKLMVWSKQVIFSGKIRDMDKCIAQEQANIYFGLFKSYFPIIL